MLRRLDEMADVAQLDPRPSHHEGLFVIDAHGAGKALAHELFGKIGIAPDLLEHEVQLDAPGVCGLVHHATVLHNRIDVDHIRIGQDGAILLPLQRDLGERAVALHQPIKKHRLLLIIPSERRSSRVRAPAPPKACR